MPLSLLDLIRPHSLSTEAFGKLWQNDAKQERKNKFRCTTVASPQVFTERLTLARITPVQTRNAETIACGTLLGNASQVALIHGKAPQTNVFELTVRARDKAFAESLNKALSDKLQQPAGP